MFSVLQSSGEVFVFIMIVIIIIIIVIVVIIIVLVVTWFEPVNFCRDPGLNR